MVKPGLDDHGRDGHADAISVQRHGSVLERILRDCTLINGVVGAPCGMGKERRTEK